MESPAPLGHGGCKGALQESSTGSCQHGAIPLADEVSVGFHQIVKPVSLLLQIGLWAFGALAHGALVEVCRVAGCVFLAAVSVAAALGFLVYGGRLFLMLQRFPIESRGRTKKLREVRFRVYG